LVVLVQVLQELGETDAKTIVIGLVALAGVFAVLALGLGLLAPLTPVLMALAAGIALFGLAVLAVGAGMFFFATGLSILAASGSAAMAVLIDAINDFLDAGPGFVERMGATWRAFAKEIEKTAPAFIRAAGVTLRAMLRETIRNVPLFGKAARTIIAEFLATVRASIPDFIKTGFAALTALLTGIRDNIFRLTNLAVDIVLRFVRALRGRAQELTDAGFDLIIDFMVSIAETIRKRWDEMQAAGARIGAAIVSGVTESLSDGEAVVGTAAGKLAGAILGPLGRALEVNSPSKATRRIVDGVGEGAVLALEGAVRPVSRSAENVGKGAMAALKASVSGLSDVLSVDPNLSPTVTPVLDLTKMQRDASRIGSMLGVSPIRAAVSYGEASNVSAETQAAQVALLETPESAGPTEIKFEQHIQSPKALSAIDIYRQTHSQLSFAKEALSGR
jgi:hypothetical protein